MDVAHAMAPHMVTTFITLDHLQNYLNFHNCPHHPNLLARMDMWNAASFHGHGASMRPYFTALPDASAPGGYKIQVVQGIINPLKSKL
jgi:hypothetical protein